MAISTSAVSTDPLLDERAAANFLDISHLTLRKWRCVGGGPEFVKIGRCVRYERSGLERFVQNRVRTSTSQVANA
jgi:hypothetical protein